MFSIVRSNHESGCTSNFVAIGNLIDHELKSCHAAIIIQKDKELFEFHFDGEMVELKTIEDDYYHKILSIIKPDDIPSFLGYCQMVEEKANPIYGYFYSGQSYDPIDGHHICDNNLSEIMTCVGFCLNVLTGFILEDEFLKFSDWPSQPENSEYLKKFCTKYNKDINDIASSHRRITPREILISAFYTTLPIRKKDIDSKKLAIEEHFKNRERVKSKV